MASGTARIAFPMLATMSTDAVAPALSTHVPAFGAPWFVSPFFEQMLAERELDSETEALVRSFADRGYVILDDLGIDDFDGFADELIAELAPLHEGGKYNRIMDAWGASDCVRRLAANSRVVDFLELLYGRRPIPFQTLNFYRGSQQPTHSDAYHFHSYPKHFMCGVWVALEDVDERNGPLHYYPGSHRLPDYDFLCPEREDELNEFIQELIASYESEEGARLPQARPGADLGGEPASRWRAGHRARAAPG